MRLWSCRNNIYGFRCDGNVVMGCGKKKENIPKPKKIESVEKNQFVNLIVADTDDYRKRHENRAVKKTLSIPSWLNSEAEQAGVNFSQVLQEALREKLKTE